jgi:hypothetical protein
MSFISMEKQSSLVIEIKSFHLYLVINVAANYYVLQCYTISERKKGGWCIFPEFEGP